MRDSETPWLAEPDLPVAQDLRAAADAWLAHMAHDLDRADNTLVAYERDLRQLLTWLERNLQRPPALADVAGLPVVPLESSNAVSLGAALRAWHADEAGRRRDLTWDAVVAPFVRVAAGGPVNPRQEHRATYETLMRAQAAFETQARLA